MKNGMKALGFVVAGLSAVLFAQSTLAAYDRHTDPYYKDAMAHAEATVNQYVVTCNGKSYAKGSNRAYVEFSKPLQEVKMMYAYSVDESDRLNGKEWGGRFAVTSGGAARYLVINPDGSVLPQPWSNSQDLEFDLVWNNGKWQVRTGVTHFWAGTSGTLESGISCASIDQAALLEGTPPVATAIQKSVSAPAEVALADKASTTHPTQAGPIKASFDCTKASTAVEGMICGNTELAALDVRLAAAYKALRNDAQDKAALKQEQVAWIKQRNACRVADCLITIYSERAEAMESARARDAH